MAKLSNNTLLLLVVVLVVIVAFVMYNKKEHIEQKLSNEQTCLNNNWCIYEPYVKKCIIKPTLGQLFVDFYDCTPENIKFAEEYLNQS